LGFSQTDIKKELAVLSGGEIIKLLLAKMFIIPAHKNKQDLFGLLGKFVLIRISALSLFLRFNTPGVSD